MAIPTIWTGMTTQLIARCLDVVAMQQRVSAENIANVHSVNYTPKQVAFDQMISQADRQSASDEATLRAIRLTPTLRTSELRFEGDRTATLDREMSDLSQSVLRYQMLTKLVSGKYELIASAINEGKK